MKDERWVIISMILLCNGIVIIEHDGRRPGIPNEPLVTYLQAGDVVTEETSLAQLHSLFLWLLEVSGLLFQPLQVVFRRRFQAALEEESSGALWTDNTLGPAYAQVHAQAFLTNASPLAARQQQRWPFRTEVFEANWTVHH
tara:strand:+ start:26 stop:448 length:423 start_codon:yes stop_codon:yes gene_type:complete